MKKSEKKELRRAEKRKLELARRKKRARTIALVALFMIAVVCLGAYYALFMSGENVEENKSVQSSLIQTETEVLVPLAGIGSNAEFYSYDSDGIKIQFFAVIGSDSEVHLALDACDVCYMEKKGYRQNGENMHCINCGNEYSIIGLGTENDQGGCWPSYLPKIIDGEYIIIEKTDLEAKKFMFE